MDIGLDGPEDHAALHDILAIIDDISRRHDEMLSDPAVLWSQGCDLADLVTDLPDPTVDVRLTVREGLNAAHGCLWQISSFVNSDAPTTPVVLASLARNALLGAARVVFMLAPAQHAERVKNASAVLRQETQSLMRLYDAAERFTHLASLVPPQDVLRQQRARAAVVRALAPQLGEAQLLQKVAEIVDQLLAERHYPMSGHSGQQGEHLAWTFNIYSGVAHGYGWPNLVPGTDSLPGHFLAELYAVTNTSQLAFDLAQERTRLRS